MSYEITQLTRDKLHGDGGQTDYFFTIQGTLGHTQEFSCTANRDCGANSTCSNIIEDDADIGVYTGLKIRNSGRNTWACKKIYMKIDGVVQRTAECATVNDLQYLMVEVSGRDKVC